MIWNPSEESEKARQEFWVFSEYHFLSIRVYDRASCAMLTFMFS